MPLVLKTSHQKYAANSYLAKSGKALTDERVDRCSIIVGVMNKSDSSNKKLSNIKAGAWLKASFSNSKLIAEAAKAVCPKKIGTSDVGGVAAIVVSSTDNFYKGVCLDSDSGLGFCAERSAIAQMIAGREYKITKVVAVLIDPTNQELCVLSPCSACRQFMMLLSENGADIDIVLGENTTSKLGDLLPSTYIPPATTLSASLTDGLTRFA